MLPAVHAGQGKAHQGHGHAEQIGVLGQGGGAEHSLQAHAPRPGVQSGVAVAVTCWAVSSASASGPAPRKRKAAPSTVRLPRRGFSGAAPVAAVGLGGGIRGHPYGKIRVGGHQRQGWKPVKHSHGFFLLLFCHKNSAGRDNAPAEWMNFLQLALEALGADALHQLLLEEEEDNQDRHQGEHRHGEGCAEVRCPRCRRTASGHRPRYTWPENSGTAGSP